MRSGALDLGLALSLPAWKRGLKSTGAVNFNAVPESLPAWKRGLK